MNFPVLSVITFTPIVAALIILMLPAQRKNEARAVALAAATFALILSFWMYLHYDKGLRVISLLSSIAGSQPWASVYILVWMASVLRSFC